jgi:hypothetical protein
MASMKTSLAAFMIAVAMTVSVSAHDFCGGWVTYIHAHDSAFDQQQQLERLAMEIGPDAVASVVVPKAPKVSGRYLVLATTCDAILRIPLTDRRGVAANAVTIPDDHPYRWQVVGSMDMADAEWSAHADAAARGIISLNEGSFVVYWTVATR